MPLRDYLVAGRPQSYINDLDPEFAGALERFIGANPGVTIYSGARSIERQTQLWNEALKKYGSPEKARKWVAPPGKSQHNFGKAADLRYKSDAVRALAHKTARQYGLTFPLANENWHIEPIGARSRQAAPQSLMAGIEAPASSDPNVNPAQAGASASPEDLAALSAMTRDPNPMAQQSADIFSGRYGGQDLMQDVLTGQNPLRRAVMSRLAQVLT